MFVKDVRVQIALTLLLVSIISLVKYFSFHLLIVLLSVLILSQLLDIVLTHFIQKKIFISFSAIVTELLIFLVLDKSSSLWIFAFASLIAITSKHIIKIKSSHIFNPAAFGLVVCSLIFPNTISWWGVSWHPILSLIIFFGSIGVLKRLRRLYIVGGFLTLYSLYYIYITGNIAGLKALIDGTVILFAFIMLPEPQTSPITGIWQKIFGLFVGIIVILISLLKNIFTDPLLLSLLSADVLSFIFRRMNSKILSPNKTNV